MRYLLDVNALLACEHQGSPHHAAFHGWAGRVRLENLHTCGLTELGFVRVSMQVFGYSLPQVQTALAGIKKKIGGFVVESPAPRLPAWVTKAAQTSDGYFAQIAQANGLTLATFDQGIPASELIR